MYSIKMVAGHQCSFFSHKLNNSNYDQKNMIRKIFSKFLSNYLFAYLIISNISIFDFQ